MHEPIVCLSKGGEMKDKREQNAHTYDAHNAGEVKNPDVRLGALAQRRHYVLQKVDCVHDAVLGDQA